jgi:hypothetical protein
MGVILIVYGVWRLLHSDWIVFLMFSALGARFLIGPDEFQGLRKALLLVVLVAIVIRLINFP